MRLPLGEVASVEFRSKFEPMCLVFAAVAAGLVWIAAVVSQHNLLSCILFVAAVLLLGFSLLGFVSHIVRIRTIHGSQVSIQVNDQIDEGEGFVISLQRLLTGERKKEPLV